MLKVLLIFAGGGLGALSRYGVSALLNKISNNSFPLGTLGVNVIGSFFMGILFCFFPQSERIPPELKVMILVGFLGAFTTFSSYSLETVTLLKEQAYLAGILNFLLNNTLSLLAVWGGYLLVNR